MANAPLTRFFVEQAHPERFVAELLLSGKFVQPADLVLRDGATASARLRSTIDVTST